MNTINPDPVNNINKPKDPFKKIKPYHFSSVSVLCYFLFIIS